ncbi:hypothetical protein KUTeg_020731 [Tegillarca granosa]|uniref:LEM domain-containing protein n=1 Tax=Tegillarca granosa TaxID=220873 RepID=A0ABQ9E8T2_TEGGR|nr:hypothetical protein KUTeg_020731 [Tegillarca granosa]
MSDKITDEELAETLERYGEKVKLPIDRRKRPLLLKKLNHFKARERPPPQLKKAASYKRGKRPEPQAAEEFSSEDSGYEDETVSELFKIKSLDTSSTSFYSNTDTLELSPNNYRRPMLRNRARNDDNGPLNSSVANHSKQQNKSSLYPDLSTLTGKFRVQRNSQGINQSESNIDYNAEEFTDSDPDESLYEVVNKSINTTFTIENNHDNPSDGLNLSRYGGSLKSRAGKSSQKWMYGAQKASPKNKLQNNSCTEEDVTEHGFRSSEQNRHFYIPRETSISTCIVALVIAFFLAITLTYVFMRRGEIGDFIYSFSSSSASDNLLICSSDKKDENVKDCYKTEDINEALKWNAKADSSQESQVPLSKIENLMKEKEAKEYNWTYQKQEIVFDLIIHNPHWGLKAYDKDKTPAEKPGEVRYLEGIVLAVVFIIFLRYHLKRAEEEQVKVYELVESIIDTIKKQYDLSEMNEEEGTSYTPYIAVQHVRDRLLAPSHRKKLMPIWNKAVKFIRENESRVRFEIQTIQGEDFEVFKWIQSAPAGSKVWQGQAFGENNSSAITLTYGPTPCLKIRNMFSPEDEDEEDWELTVQDALLEKCKGNNGRDLDDPMFGSWAFYKSKLTKVDSSSLLVFPSPTIKQQKRVSDDFFVITADKAYEEKIKNKKEKERKRIEVEDRKKQRLEAKIKKEQLKQEKSSKKGRNIREVKAKN